MPQYKLPKVFLRLSQSSPGLLDHSKFAIWKGMPLWDRFRRAVKHAFALGPMSSKLSAHDRHLLEKIAGAIVTRRLDTPAVLLLESSEPLHFLSSQVIQGLRPFLDLVCAPQEIERFVHILEQRDGIPQLVRIIQEKRESLLLQADSSTI